MSLKIIKGPLQFPIIGSAPYIWWNGGVTKMVHVFRSLYKDYGSIVQLSALGKKSIVIFDPDIFMEVHRAGGSCPFGATDTLWMLHSYFDKKKKSSLEKDKLFRTMDYGTGQEWLRKRKFMQNGLFSPEASSHYADHLTEVAQDASNLIANEIANGKSLQEFLQRFSFEMVTYSLLGTRLGTLNNKEPLLGATIKSIECASAMMMGPLQEFNMTLNTKVWRNWESSVDYMLIRTSEIIKNAIERKYQNEGKKSYIDVLLEANELTKDEIVANIPGLMMAGFETVASTLHWTFIHLAKNQLVQDVLFEEISNVLKDGRSFQRDDISNMPYLRCVIREVHRLTPTAFANLRKLDEPIIVNDYCLPAKAWLCFSPVGISMDPKFVDSPNDFNPERYLNRVTRKEREWALFDHPLMRDGFGFGVRKCLGGRLAEMEIWIAICTILRDYKITMEESSKDYDIVNHAATYPSPAPKLIFKRRN
ncbi:hypothetical protein ABK040_007762 [Willaertia magna]